MKISAGESTLRRWWLVGDVLYYVGLISAGLSAVHVPFAIVSHFLGVRIAWRQFIMCLAAVSVGSVVFWIGVQLKKHSHRLAKRDCISDC